MKYFLDIEFHAGYPRLENEHSALEDAKWNKKLYKTLHTI